MVGQKAANWSPYDFTPITLPHPKRKRPNPAIPQARQSSSAISSDTELSRRAQALPTALSNVGEQEEEEAEEEDERAVQSFPSTNQSHQNRQPQMNDTTTSFSPTPDQMRSTGRAPGIGDILGSFRQPAAPPAFKEEPVDEDIMKLPLRKPASGTRGRYRKTRTSTPAASKPATASARRQAQRRSDHDHDQLNEEVERGDHEQQNTIVDLTTDDEEQAQSQTRGYDNRITGQYRRGILPYQDPTLPQHGDPNVIPETAIQQVREQYRQEHVILPMYVKTWQHLQDFAGRNQNQSSVTPAFLSQIRDFYATLGSAPYGRDLSYPQSIFPARELRNRGHSLLQNESYMSDIEHQVPDNIDGLSPTGSAATEPNIKRECNTQSLRTAGAQRLSSRPTYQYSGNGRSLRSQDKNQRQAPGGPSHPHNSEQPRINVNQSLSADVIGVLTQPSDALLDLLPPTAPSGHPHLVSLWNSDLLKLPTDQHGHVDLVDTVVSIMAKYDMKDQSTIKAFLDINECPHFFFLFKSRTSAWHSWSIEREWDIVTIGLERNNRASNTAESTRPSSGQFDVTVIFKMDKPTSVDTTLTAPEPDPLTTTKSTTILTTGAVNSSFLTAKNALPASQANPVPTNTDNSQTTPPARSQPTIPGKWNLFGTTIFPAQPSLSTFLWSTPPNRGADDVSRYHHPTQTSLLPPAHLSTLARYLQHTAFTCTAMEAEFQVAWGRKVRYDAQLGRVRPTWDYALKGAKTQKEKRKRGDYNVVPVVEKKNGGGGGNGGSNPATQATKDEGDIGRKGDTTKKGGSRDERPGAEVSLDWLAGRDGMKDVKTTPVRDRRKRPKREEDDGSGSEYMGSSDDE